MNTCPLTSTGETLVCFVALAATGLGSEKAPMRVDPCTGFCIDWLLGYKYDWSMAWAELWYSVYGVVFTHVKGWIMKLG